MIQLKSIIIINLVWIAVVLYLNSEIKRNKYFKFVQISDLSEQNSQENEFSRDFYRHNCKNRTRIGGLAENLAKAPHDLYRTEGAWFICQDKELKLIINDCLVLSFGINQDPSFDQQINNDFKCQIESFDPFVEAGMFQQIRAASSRSDEVTLQVNEKWRFHRIGLVGDVNSVKMEKQIGWMARLNEILDYTGLNNKVIDIFKMDIENGEWEFLINLDMSYMCKHVKQFVLETHTQEVNFNVFTLNLQEALKVMRRLERCFLLFHRDTRFYKDQGPGLYSFWKTEFQEPITYKIDLNEFKSELKIIDFMVTYGELYFVNKEFLL